MFWKIRFWLALLLILTQTRCETPHSLVDVTVDLVLVVHGEIFDRRIDLNYVKATMRNLSNFFQIGENKTRAAVVDCRRSECSVLLNFTGDESTYERILKNITVVDTSNSLLYPALNSIRTNQFLSTNRPKAAIVFSRGHVSDLDRAENETRLLRENGTWLYLVTDSELVKTAFDLFGDVQTFLVETSNASSKFVNDSILQMIKGDVDRKLCVYETACGYGDRDLMTCVGHWWNPLVSLQTDCGKINSPPVTPPTEKCHHSRCRKMCDRLWPWSNSVPECDSVCDEKANATRNGSAPANFLRHCPRKFVCDWCVRRRYKTRIEADPPERISTIAAILIGLLLQMIIVGVVVYYVLANRRHAARQAAFEKAVKKNKLRLGSPKSSMQKLPPPINVTPSSPPVYKPRMPKKAETKILKQAKKGLPTAKSGIVASQQEKGDFKKGGK